jgi:hypothetical protein
MNTKKKMILVLGRSPLHPQSALSLPPPNSYHSKPHRFTTSMPTRPFFIWNRFRNESVNNSSGAHSAPHKQPPCIHNAIPTGPRASSSAPLIANYVPAPPAFCKSRRQIFAARYDIFLDTWGAICCRS